jgi:hypothetical protein
MAEPTTIDAPAAPADPEAPDWGPWHTRIAASLRRIDDRVDVWQQNVAKRAGAITSGTTQTTTASQPVNQDWPLTKAKIAQLYSQTPEVRGAIRTGYDQFASAVAQFLQDLNATLADISIGATIEEVLSDVINASGIGGVLVTCDKRTETKQMPEVDPATLPPDVQQAVMTGRFQIPMVDVTAVADVLHRCDRISPPDLLTPADFTGSDYDKARWLGHRDRMTKAQAKTALRLTDEQIEEALGTDDRKSNTRSLNQDTNKFRDTEVVTFTQLFYWRHFYHPEETSFHALQRLVFVDGLDEPVINEPYQVQERTDDGRMIGVRRNPIQVLTLTYLSDDCLPPSDSTISRGVTNEIEDSRKDMALQRKHSVPMRWGDTNRVSANQREAINRGEFQGFLWTNGPGDRAVGEVSRAAFPPERYELDRILKSEETELWQVGSNQAGAFATGERSAREAGIIEKNFQRRVGQEQDKAQRFFLRAAELVAAHIAFYGTFKGQDAMAPAQKELANAFTYSVRVDSTVRMDADEQIEKLTRGLNLTVQSGYVNPKPVITKIWELLGVDPTTVVIDPQPKPPEPVKVSVSNALDVMNPVILGLLMRTQQAPTEADVAAAEKMLAAVVTGTAQAAPPAPVGPPRDVQTPPIAHGGWEAAPRIERRAEDGAA